MPPVGKLSSVVQKFEQTIEQNNAAGVASGMYLTKLAASSTKDTTTRSKARSTLATRSTHTTKRLDYESTNRTLRNSHHVGHHENNDWDAYIEKRNGHDDNSVSEISQDSFMFEEAVVFDDPFECSAEFNPFGLEEVPQTSSDSVRKQRPVKEKRGVGRLGNRTTKAKLEVKAAKKSNTKEKPVDIADEELHNESSDSSVSDDDQSEHKQKEEKIPTRKDESARRTLQKKESFRRRSDNGLDKSSQHSSKSFVLERSEPRRSASSNNKKSSKDLDDSERDGFSLTYVAKRDGQYRSDSRQLSSSSNSFRGSDRKEPSTRSHRSTRNTANESLQQVSTHSKSMQKESSRRDVSPHRNKYESPSKSRKDDDDNDDDFEIKSDRPSPQRLVKSCRESSKSKSTKTVEGISTHSRSFRERGTMDGKSSHTTRTTTTNSNNNKFTNTLEPSSAQMRFFGNGESKVKIRTKTTTTVGTNRTSGHHDSSSNNLDHSDHTKQSNESPFSNDASTQISSLSSNSKLASSRYHQFQPQQQQQQHQHHDLTGVGHHGVPRKPQLVTTRRPSNR